MVNKNVSENGYFFIIVALLSGLIIGMLMPSRVFMPVRLFFHNIYIRLNPDSQKDSKTLIIEHVTKNTVSNPQYNIFEKPEKRENEFILYIKKIFYKDKKSNNTQTIENFILN